jgi:hypothetical protein
MGMAGRLQSTVDCLGRFSVRVSEEGTSKGEAAANYANSVREMS